jgi:BON domain
MFKLFRRSTSAFLGAMGVLTMVVLAASAGSQRAAEPAASPSPEKKLSYRDIQLSVHARKALAEDSLLGPANLGVRVQDNVAVLWGPAPSEELKRRAVEIVKKVKGVYEVRDTEMYIAAPTAAIEAPPLPPPSPEEAMRTESASPDSVSGIIGSLTGRLGQGPSLAPGVVLRPPLPLGESEPARTISAAPPVDGLSAAVEQLHQSEVRFRALDCRLDGDVVVLRAGAGRGEDMMAFARAISHLPGLSRIAIRNDEAAVPR